MPFLLLLLLSSSSSSSYSSSSPQVWMQRVSNASPLRLMAILRPLLLLLLLIAELSRPVKCSSNVNPTPEVETR